MSNKQIFSWIQVVPLTLLLISCGRDSGYVHQGSPVRRVEKRTGDKDRENPKEQQQKYESVDWLFACGDSDLETPEKTHTKLYYKNTNHVKLHRDLIHGAKFRVSGQSCEALDLHREIVIAVDVSGSNHWHDPRNDQNSCKRLEILKELLQTLPPDSRARVFTFAEEVLNEGSQPSQVLDEILNDFGNNESAWADTFCHADGASYFHVGLRKAKDLFVHGRQKHVSRELYLISDGDQRNALTEDIFDLGKELRSDMKVKIAALQLVDPDAKKLILRKIVSTLDSVPLLQRIEPEEALPIEPIRKLTHRIAQESVNRLETIELSLSIEGKQPYSQVINLKNHPLDFTLEERLMDSLESDRIHLLYKYIDRFTRIEERAHLEWVDSKD